MGQIDDLGDAVSLLITVAITVLFVWLWLGPTIYRPFKNRGLEKFRSFLAGLAARPEDYEYFTTGHIIWSQVSINEIEKIISNMAVRSGGETGPFPALPRFLLHVHEHKRRVYFVPTNAKVFDWDSIPHYEQYVRDRTDDG
ncbi:hypothetical protein FV139_13790 [Parahaliea maris]|uniref:Uncharacterized protein n=1 Tax=Parahaliea maris TaxID=2716870 RepID=A0A5C9A094_9GAMM|nr:hypothetical protein [Parahaliea maris]TXS93017.1 hypothetical protein FV139_13790 [Parahaliea maris]